MTQDARQKLRASAVTVLGSMHGHGDRWVLQTSNSYRRIGSPRGDGDVLCATTHPYDKHPDLLAAPGVLAYVVAAQPRVVLDLLDALHLCEEELVQARKQHAADQAELERLRREISL